MALTGMAIFKHMPKTNCGQCGVPTCLAFAMKLAAGGASLDQCPFVSDAAKELLAEASAPPIRGVTIGEGEFALKIGEVLVMHRHEKTFFNPPGYALLIEDTEEHRMFFGAPNDAASPSGTSNVRQDSSNGFPHAT
jgi:acetyl-CoA decarbonylase/synthase complex subunit gamma